MTPRRFEETDTNGASWMSAPWQLKVIAQYGVPSAIALYLVYALSAAMPTRAEIVYLAEQRKAEIAAISKSLETHASNTGSDMADIKRILAASCVNQATTPVQRLRCLGQIPIAGER